MTKPIWWSATISKRFYADLETIKTFFDKIADRYVIGEEVGKDGYQHWQCKVVLTKGMDLDELVEYMPSVHWSPTHTKNFEYEEKEGKFYRSWEKALNKYALMEMNEWQADAVCRWG